jgi:hypothetical protein
MATIKKSIQIIRKVGAGDNAVYPGELAFIGNEVDSDTSVSTTAKLTVDDDGTLKFLKAATGKSYIDGLLIDPKTIVVDSIAKRNALAAQALDLYEGRTVYVKKNTTDGALSGLKYMLRPLAECDVDTNAWGGSDLHWVFDNNSKITEPDWKPLTIVSGVATWDAGSEYTPLAKVTVPFAAVTLKMNNLIDASCGILQITKGITGDVIVTFDSSFTNRSGVNDLVEYTIVGPVGYTAYLSFVKDGSLLEWRVADENAVDPNFTDFTQAEKTKLSKIEAEAQKNLPFGSLANTVTEGNDPRLSDQRIPLDGSVNVQKMVQSLIIAIDDVPITERVKLEDPLNWNYEGAYSGPPISGTYQGQHHSTSSYTFRCEFDNVWTRTPRV